MFDNQKGSKTCVWGFHLARSKRPLIIAQAKTLRESSDIYSPVLQGMLNWMLDRK